MPCGTPDAHYKICEENHGALKMEFIQKNWRPILCSALKREASAKLMVPFIRHKCIQGLFEGADPERIQLITRFSVSDFYSGVSDLDALEYLLGKGAEIKGVQNLHSKLYIFGNAKAVVGSANLTDAALSRNEEFGVSLSAPEDVEGCVTYFDSMWQNAGDLLTQSQINDWRRELGEYKEKHGGLPRSNLPDYGQKLPHNSAPHFSGGLVDDYPQYVVKFFGLSEDRWSVQESVREAVLDSGCYWACTYPENRRPRAILDGVLMFMAFMTDDGDMHIFGSGVGHSYRSGIDDATIKDIQESKWKSKWPRYIRMRDVQFFDGTLGDGVSLKELMATHGVQSFVRTADRAAREEQNINPANSVRQKPDVKLTPQSASWLVGELNRLREKHGMINGVQLQRERQTTQSGYLNRNNQQVLRKTARPGNGSNQYVYLMECRNCGHLYGANGADIHERKCPVPECGNGAAGLAWR